jgi:sigma54-dependent transcription regulator
MRRRVAIAILGTTLDSSGKDDRWKKWRPTVALCQQPGLFIDRLELIHDVPSQRLATQIIADIETVSPATEVRQHIIGMNDPWDFSEVYTELRDFARAYVFDPEKEDYLVNITTGTHVAQICWFLLTEARFIPARLLQLSPRKREGGGEFSGGHSIIDLDLSRYDAIATRFAAERDEATSFLKSGIPTRNPAYNQMIDSDREGGDKVACAGSADRADRGRQVAAGQAHLRTQEGAATGLRRLHRGQLRDTAWRPGDVDPVRPRQRRLHRRPERAGRADEIGQQGRFVP